MSKVQPTPELEQAVAEELKIPDPQTSGNAIGELLRDKRTTNDNSGSDRQDRPQV